MILLDDTPESLAKSRLPTRRSESVDEEYAAPPPAYPGSFSSSQPPDVEAHAGALHPSIGHPRHDAERRKHAPRRYLKALGIGALIWVGIGFLVRSAFAVVHWNRSTFSQGQTADHLDRPHRISTLPRPIDGKVERCVSASSVIQLLDSRAESVVSFDLPLYADVLYIFGRGALSRGTITFMPMEGERPRSGFPDRVVKVDITTTYQAKFALDAVNFCLLERLAGQHGIGILTPSGEDHDLDLLDFKIDVRFPLPAQGLWPSPVNSFETNLPLFRHNMHDLNGIVKFDSVSFISRNAPMHIEYLVANEATVTTSNAVIKGSFNVTRSLFVQTSNQDIDAAVELGNRGWDATKLTLLNQNGAIDARLSLVSQHMGRGNEYDVVARTENGRLSLPISSQPVYSKLLVDAHTSNAPASVKVPITFEGRIEARTSNADATVGCDPLAKDPTGNRRLHECMFEQRSVESVNGSVRWPQLYGNVGGKVSVVSSNSPVSVTSG
ncbi:hypothetical protein BN946_scf184985.g4 [Trametes cinnabarina]|uniref:DUF7330 domain-containing protein n=1 Tax=Pycnoporus cinnabarinus TaxID=5643 RepID=A0A060SDY7_PYCCI|nr:hypothetical protein BN946_scf184985.g4 [Trametes cinnabarina]